MGRLAYSRPRSIATGDRGVPSVVAGRQTPPQDKTGLMNPQVRAPRAVVPRGRHPRAGGPPQTADARVPGGELVADEPDDVGDAAAVSAIPAGWHARAVLVG